MTTTISTTLPDLDLEAQATLTVDAGDASAVLKEVTVHVSQNAPQDELAPFVVSPLFAYGANE